MAPIVSVKSKNGNIKEPSEDRRLFEDLLSQKKLSAKEIEEFIGVGKVEL
jgi:hypothetical protein